MSNKSGVAEQVISHPTGGGAVTGIGEKFSPDLFTGTGNFTVPIDLPAGRNEFQPELSLAYSTGNGNGPFGLGWTLSVPGVGRKTSEGVPLYDDAVDTFILSGADDLIPVSEEADGSPDAAQRIRYQPRTEGLFARIIHHKSATDDHWRVWSKDGLKSTYGTPETRGADPAVLTDPSGPENIFAWRLTRTEDPFGNQIAYEYLRDSGDNDQHRWDQPLLECIRYVDYEGANDTEYLVSVTFEYEDRPDPFSEYRSGFEIRTTQRCKRITIQTHTHDEQLVRKYELTYLDEREELTDRLPLNGVSLLSRIEVVGDDDDGTERLPPLEFAHTQFDPEGREFSSLDGDLPARSLGSPNLELADLFGNGLSDIVEINDTVRYWRNLGDGRFDEPRSMDSSPAGLKLADQAVQLIDANGDSRIDLLATTNGLSGYFPLAFGGHWDADSFQRYDTAPSFNLEDPNVQLIDLDGDGVTDAIRSGSRFECFFNNPDEGWNDTKQVPRGALEVFPDVNFSDPRVNWADLSGDGLQDIALVHDGNIEYWPNLGHGNWGHRLHMRNSPRFPYNYDPERLLFGDVDGDGRSDLVYVGDNQVLLWINQGGERWSDRIEITGTPSVSDMDAVRLVDMLGTGIQGVLWSANAEGTRDSTFFLDFTGGTKPYLLSEMDNHKGAITRVSYAPSTEFYLADETDPNTRWETPLPFPVQVVAQVEAIDEISEGKLTTEYRYHHGYWDGAEREFRGFGMVEQTDSESFEDYNDDGLHGEAQPFADVGSDDREQFSPPTVTKTWFHQGPVGPETGDWREPDYSDEYWDGDPPALSRSEETAAVLRSLPRRDRRDALRTLRGRVLRRELYARDGSARADRPYTVTERFHGVREEEPPENGDGRGMPEDGGRHRIFFPHALGTRTTEWERGDDPKTQCTFVGSYDDYSQARSEIGIAVPRGRDFREPAADGADVDPYIATCTVTDYAQRDDESTYVVDREARSTTYEVENDGREDLYTLRRDVERAVEAETLPDAAVIGQRVNFYDGEAFRGADFGTVGDHGALVRTETLALTDETFQDIYEADDVASTPPYLTMGAGTEWTDYPDSFRDEYPRAFVENLPSRENADLSRPGLRITPAGYGVTDGGDDSPYVPGHFVASDRRAYDFQTGADDEERGLLVVQRDELSGETTIEYDDFDLLPTRVEDPANLETTASYDYRVFEPTVLTDSNGNRTAMVYTPLGLPERIAVTGGEGEEVGDTLAQPGTRYEYDFDAFDECGEPVSVETIRRETHRWDLLAEHSGSESADLFPPDELERFPDRFVRTREFSDGFGRVVQSRTQAEDVVFGDETFGGEALLVDQAVLVHDDEPEGDRPDAIKDVLGSPVGVETGTTGSRLVRTLLRDADGPSTTVEQYDRAREAVDALEDGAVDAVVLDEAVALEFETRQTVSEAVTTGPGSVVGHEPTSGDRPRVVVSGWQTFDNKGQVVEQYEPFFDRGFAFRSREDASADDRVDRFGQRVRLSYDPRGRVVRTVEPDGSVSQVVVGEPDDLTEPDDATPTPWATSTYDANDNAGRTHPPGSEIGPHHHSPAAYDHHWDTPTSTVVDALGRPAETTERTRDDAESPPVERRSRTAYDARGNPQVVSDSLDRSAFRYGFDLRDEALRTESVDAGTRVAVLDAAGNELERRDGRGTLCLRAYDEFDRLRRVWARDADADPLTLREHLVFGDDPEVDGESRNLLGELYQHYDEAGLVTVEARDFKGNVLARRRRVLRDDVVRSGAPVDWRPPDGSTLSAHAETLLASDGPADVGTDADGGDAADATVGDNGGSGYLTSYAYDALDRPVAIRCPTDVDSDRKELRPSYDRSGALEGLVLASRPGTGDEERETFVERIAYDATGQRTFIAYGNGLMTRYAADPETFRPVRLRTDAYERPEASTYRATGPVVQDYAYEYDLAGNVTAIRDRTPDSGVLDSPLGRHAFDRKFAYDPRYRLRSATGRECGTAANRAPWESRTRCDDLTRTRPYAETYRYDAVGNLTELRHTSGQPGRDATDDGQFTRRFETASESNRLQTTTVGETTYDYAHDANGNRRASGGHRRFEWGYDDRLRAFQREPGEEEPSVVAHHRYDADGQRVEKLVEKPGGSVERTVYVDGVFEHHRVSQGGEARQTNTLHLVDDERRIATVRVGGSTAEDGPAVRYRLGDHADVYSVVVDGEGDVIGQEEYTPYGETSFGNVAGGRYRYMEVERDDASGMSYFGGRYYSSGVARWTSPDPAFAGPPPAEGRMGSPGGDWSTLYTVFASNPIRYTDPDGRSPESKSTRWWAIQLMRLLTFTEPDVEQLPPRHTPSRDLVAEQVEEGKREGDADRRSRRSRTSDDPRGGRWRRRSGRRRSQRSVGSRWMRRAQEQAVQKRERRAARRRGQAGGRQPIRSSESVKRTPVRAGGGGGGSTHKSRTPRDSRSGSALSRMGRAARGLTRLAGAVNVISGGVEALEIVAKEDPSKLPVGLEVKLYSDDPPGSSTPPGVIDHRILFKYPTGYTVENIGSEIIYRNEAGEEVSKEEATKDINTFDLLGPA